MLLDARRLSAGEVLDADLCIVGAGAAGITLAQALSTKTLRILLLESGGLEFDAPTQALCEGDVVGVATEPLDVSRLRYFGGSTNHWAGWCRPLEPWDLAQWPIGAAGLAPWYPKARAVCENGPADDAVAAWAEAAGAPALPFDAARLRTAIFHLSAPTRFGEVYGEALKQSPGVRVCLNANAVGLRREGARVAAVRFRSLGGPELEARAARFVLTAGGLENPRLLLLSGLGAEHDMVGRCFMDHAWYRDAGVLAFARPDPRLQLYYDESSREGSRGFGVLMPSEAAMRREEIGNFRIALFAARGSFAGVDSAKALGAAAAERRWPEDFARHLRNVMADLDAVADSAYKTAFGARSGPFSRRIGAGAVTAAYVDLNVEQRPERASRVTLSPRRDALGLNRIALDWRLGADERRTVERALTMFAEECGRVGLGRLRLRPAGEGANWAGECIGSRHHMGATRMADEPRDGVVDRNCRMHGLENLYVAGSSVFPTSGAANPTLTIVALALRLAEHLSAA